MPGRKWGVAGFIVPDEVIARHSAAPVDEADQLGAGGALPVGPDAVKMIFPNAGDRGTHVNASGMALAPNAPNPANAMSLMEFLVSNEAQKLYAEADGEYPVVPGVPASALVESWGPLKADPTPLSKIAEFRKKASEMIDRVRFDQGPNS